MVRKTTAVIAALVLSGCVSGPEPERVYTGLYAEGLETMTFTIDGSEEHWVATGDGIYALQNSSPREYSADGMRVPFSVRARVVGVLSPPGQYGHLGMFRREISISRLVEVLNAGAE